MVLDESLLPAYERLKSGLLRLIDEGKISREDAARVLPELRESEDERVRKSIVKTIEQCPDDFLNPKNRDRMLAYLEKQEQKPNIELIQRSWYMEGYHDREFGKEPKWTIKTGEGGPKHELNPKYGQPLADEQKPAEKPSMLELLREHLVNTPKEQLDAEFEELKEFTISKPAEWHPEDEQNLNICLSYIKDESLRSWLIDAIHVRYDMPAEWSEEDEKMRDATIDIVSGSFYEPLCPRKEMLAWLKSLHPSWKPSEEQMNCLCAAVDAAIRKHNESVGGYKPARVLKSLYEDLQKL